MAFSGMSCNKGGERNDQAPAPTASKNPFWKGGSGFHVLVSLVQPVSIKAGLLVALLQEFKGFIYLRSHSLGLLTTLIQEVEISILTSKSCQILVEGIMT